jgi:rod shape-determining protein MreC
MLSLHRWWVHNRLNILIVSALVAAAYGLRATQSAALLELYRWVAQPFTPNPSVATRLTSAAEQELQLRIAELEAENKKLSNVLQYKQAQTRKGFVVPVIGRSANHWWQHITLGQGSEQGLQVGYVVTAPGGTVGRIIQVTANTSRVLLISDQTSRIGALISRSRATGVIRGQGNTQAVMEFFNKDPVVKVGDAVSTSNFSQLFPPGLPIGKVVALNLNKSPAPEAIIELTAPLAFLETVVVHPHKPLSDNQPKLP